MTRRTSPLAEAFESFFEIAETWLGESERQMRRMATRLESPSVTMDEVIADGGAFWALAARTWSQGGAALMNAMDILADPPETYSVHGFELDDDPGAEASLDVEDGGEWAFSFEVHGLVPTDELRITAHRPDPDAKPRTFHVECRPSPGLEEPTVTVKVTAADGTTRSITCPLTPNNQVDT